MEQEIYKTPDQIKKRITYLKDAQRRDEECSYFDEKENYCTSGSIEEDINDIKYPVEEV